MVSGDFGGRYDRPPRNAGTLASGRLSSLLALEIELAGRAPANRNRIAGTDQADQHGEPALGCCVKKTRERHAVRKMKEDPSEPSCRGRLQTAISCFGQKPRW